MFEKKCWTICVVVLGVGCTAEVTNEEALVVERLAAKGFETSAVRFEGDEVIVEGDIVMSRQSILEEDLNDESSEESLVEKGYWYNPTINRQGRLQQLGVPSARGIYFDFAGDVPARWRSALEFALVQWDNSHECISAGSSQRIEVEMANLNAAVAADARFPITNMHLPTVPGTRIRIANSVKGSADTAFMRGLMIHELGHALGFTHPWGDNRFAIPDTSANRGNCAGGAGCAASYSTVMDYAYETSLQADDKKSVDLMFKKTAPLPRDPSHCPGE